MQTGGRRRGGSPGRENHTTSWIRSRLVFDTGCGAQFRLGRLRGNRPGAGSGSASGIVTGPLNRKTGRRAKRYLFIAIRRQKGSKTHNHPPREKTGLRDRFGASRPFRVHLQRGRVASPPPRRPALGLSHGPSLLAGFGVPLRKRRRCAGGADGDETVRDRDPARPWPLGTRAGACEPRSSRQADMGGQGEQYHAAVGTIWGLTILSQQHQPGAITKRRVAHVLQYILRSPGNPTTAAGLRWKTGPVPSEAVESRAQGYRHPGSVLGWSYLLWQRGYEEGGAASTSAGFLRPSGTGHPAIRPFSPISPAS